MYPIENVLSTDTTQDLVSKFNNLANHNRSNWRTLSFTIDLNEQAQVELIPAQADTYLLFPQPPQGFLLYAGESLSANQATIISIEVQPETADIVPETTLATVPLEVVEMPLTLPNLCVDISTKPLVLQVLQESPVSGVQLHLFLHVLFTTLD
jgi:hypothetical protein